MASDRQQFRQMEDHREYLLNERMFSVPSQLGTVAIVTMFDPTFVNESISLGDSPEAMSQEAKRIQRYMRWMGKSTLRIEEATAGQFGEVISDPQISDIAVIGHGSLSRLRAPGMDDGTAMSGLISISFYDAVTLGNSKPTISHLKLGKFWQRTSGHMNTDSPNVPFSWGFLADRTNHWGSPQQGFSPSPRHFRPQAGLHNIAEFFGLNDQDLQEKMAYEDAKELFRKRQSLSLRRYAVPKFALPAYDYLRGNQAVHGFYKNARRRLGAIGLGNF